MIRDSAEYAEILRHPREDGPRERLARSLESIDPPRAEYIRADLRIAQLEATAIARRHRATEEVEELWRRGRDLFNAHGKRWAAEDKRPTGGTWARGFLEVVGISPASRLDLITQLVEGWPVLHMEIDASPTYPWFETFQSVFPRLASIDLDGSDADVRRLLDGVALKDLRRLTLRSKGTELTERAMHAVCEADLPQLEDLRFVAKGTRDPCEGMLSYDSYGAITDAQRSQFGEELEARYGWKKYLHAVSRFSEFSYSIGVLDILPPLPDDLLYRSRRWD